MKKNKVIIALTGFKQCGKDTIANEIEKLIPGIQRLAFANLLKEYISKTLGFNIDEIEFLKTKNEIKFQIGKKTLNMRNILITFANELRALTDDGIWAKLTLERANLDNSILITDLRFLTEEKILREFAQNNNYKLIIIKIDSDLNSCKENEAEKEVNLIKEDFIIFNKKNNLQETKQELKKIIENVIKN